MNRVDVKAIVERAVGGEWQAFAARHPALSQAIDRELLVEQCLASVRHEPEFVEAVRQVQAMGLAHEVLQDLALKLVRGVLRMM